MQDIKEIFGKNVQKYRRQFNMTQEQLAEQLDISQTFLANIERGKRGVSMENIAAIAECFSVPYTALFETAENPANAAPPKMLAYALKERFKPYLEKALQDCVDDLCQHE